jgi:hypothetical protein
MFGKIFASLWTGSMCGKADAQLVFVYILANADADGMFDQTPEVIATLTGLSLEQVEAALALLTAPDPRSRSKAEEGRRLLLVDPARGWGWFIVNYAKYREMRDEEQRREQNRLATRRWREKQSGSPMLTAAHGRSPVSNVSIGEPKQKQKQKQKQITDETLPPVESFRPTQSAGPSPGGGSDPSGPGEGSGSPVLGLPGFQPGETPGNPRGPLRPSGDVWLPVGGAGAASYAPETLVLADWRAAYPAVDVEAEFRKMRAWLEANRPARRLTARGAPAFVVHWLGRAASDATRLAARGGGRSARRSSDSAYARANAARISGSDNE